MLIGNLTLAEIPPAERRGSAAAASTVQPNEAAVGSTPWLDAGVECRRAVSLFVLFNPFRRSTFRMRLRLF